MIAQPYPLWIIWDETDGQQRWSYLALVVGWLDITLQSPGRAFTPNTPLPVVMHPDTQLPATLGHDNGRSVSRMELHEGLHAEEVATARREVRQENHGGLRDL